MNILVATSNKGKLAEIQAILTGSAIKVVGLDEMKMQPPSVPDETGHSFFENALLKAKFYAGCCRIPVIAEDSGLEVKALGGAPGILSARYAGTGATDAKNNAKLLQNLKPYRNQGSSRIIRANFTACVVIYLPGGKIIRSTGKVYGQIAEQSAGQHGFGYDPIFIPEGFSQTMAELGPAVKNTISHRKKAFEKIKEKLMDLK